MADYVSDAADPGVSHVRPLPVVASALWWSSLTVLAFGYATYIAVTLKDGTPEMWILTVLFFVSCSILWFLWSYWHGQDWTRTFVIVASVVKTAFFLSRASHFYPRYQHGFEGFLYYVRIIDLVFSIYVLYWLMTKEARRYFSP
jgi:hypothetical protein